MLKEGVSGHQWRGPEERKTIRFSVSLPDLAPEEGQALQKHGTFSPLGSLGKTLSTMKGASLAIHGLPVGTAKKEKKSHGQARCQHRMFYADGGWAKKEDCLLPY